MGIYQQPSISGGYDVRQGAALGIQLRNELKNADCFSQAPTQQILHMVVVITLYTVGYSMLLTQPGIEARLASLVLLAFVSLQAGYIAHEAGHKAITKRRLLSITIGQFFNTFLTALCYSHFQKIHVSHHSHCNE